MLSNNFNGSTSHGIIILLLHLILSYEIDHVYDPEEYCSSIYNEKKKKTFEETGESSNSIGKSHNTSEN